MHVVSNQPVLFITMSADADRTTISSAARLPSADGELFTTEIRHNDVLSGRGVPIINHPGNRRFRRLVLDRKREYASSCRHQFKNEIALQIIKTIKDEGGRFIKEVKTSAEATLLGIPRGTKAWAFNDDKQIMQKVKQALREPDSNPAAIEEDIDIEGSQTLSLENDQRHVELPPQMLQPLLNSNVDTIQASDSTVYPGMQHMNENSALHQNIFPPQGNQRYLQEFLWLSQVSNNQEIIDMMRPHGHDANIPNLSLYRQPEMNEYAFSQLGAPESIISTEMNAERVHTNSGFFSGQMRYDQQASLPSHATSVPHISGSNRADMSQQFAQRAQFNAGNDLRQLLRQSNSTSQLQSDDSFNQSLLLNSSLPLPMTNPDRLTTSYGLNVPYLLEHGNNDQPGIDEPQWSGRADSARLSLNSNKRQLPSEEKTDTFKQLEDFTFAANNDKIYGKKPKNS
jgi:hypothetical protein